MYHFKFYLGMTLVSLCLRNNAFTQSNFTKIYSNVGNNDIFAISSLDSSNLLCLLNNGLEYFAGIVNTSENKLASFADFINDKNLGFYLKNVTQKVKILLTKFVLLY